MEPKIERTAFNSQRDQIFWHLCGFFIGLWQRQSLLLSEPIRYKKTHDKASCSFRVISSLQVPAPVFSTEAGITLGCAKLVRFVCAVLLSNCQDICGISYGLLSFCKQHISGSLEWSRLSLLPASHPVHSDLIQLNPQPDAPPPTTLVLSHNRSMSFMKTPGTPGDSHCFRDDSSCRHSPNTTTIRRKERYKCCRQSKERSDAELASGWQMNWGSISSGRGPFIFALCVTRVVWEAFVRRGKSLPS